MIKPLSLITVFILTLNIVHAQSIINTHDRPIDSYEEPTSDEVDPDYTPNCSCNFENEKCVLKNGDGKIIASSRPEILYDKEKGNYFYQCSQICLDLKAKNEKECGKMLINREPLKEVLPTTKCGELSLPNCDDIFKLRNKCGAGLISTQIIDGKIESVCRCAHKGLFEHEVVPEGYTCIVVVNEDG